METLQKTTNLNRIYGKSQKNRTLLGCTENPQNMVFYEKSRNAQNLMGIKDVMTMMTIVGSDRNSFLNLQRFNNNVSVSCYFDFPLRFLLLSSDRDRED